MSATQPKVFPAPFDAVASRYDDTFTSSIIGRAQRAAVWKELTRAFRPGDRVLEIGCGTGVDACHLGERGVEVLACDPSPEMIDVAEGSVRKRGLQAVVRTCVLRGEDIWSLPADQMFDGAFSNFGALNCVEDLAPVAKGLARLLRPGSSAVLCWMGPFCLWEMLSYLLRGNFAKAFRRLRLGGVSAKLGHQAFVQVRYPSVAALAKACTPQFRLRSVQGIGVAVPPSYLEPWARRHSRLIRWSEQFDDCFGRWPGFRSIGDHVLVRLERVQEEGEE